MNFDGSTAIVTGANGILGDAFVRELAARCETVHAGVRDPAAYEAPAPNVRPLRIDLSDRETLDLCIAEGDGFSEADVLVNNAGALALGLLEEIELDDLYNSIQVNLTGLIHLTRAVLPGMLERGRGSIINNSSFSGYAQFPLASVYAAGKAGVVAFSNSLRRELDGTGVSVTHLVTPGVRSPMLDATEAAYAEHFDTAGWETVDADEWAKRSIESAERGVATVHPSGKSRAAVIASRGPLTLLDSASRRMFKR